VTVRLREVPVPAGVEFVAVSVGHTHACALTQSGQAYCWGSNEYGQLGTGDLASQQTPAPVTGGHTFTLIDAGEQSTCALTGDSKAYRWCRYSYRAAVLVMSIPLIVRALSVAPG